MHRWDGPQSFPYVITIFSAPNYCGYYENKASVLIIDKGNLSLKQYEETETPYRLPDNMDVFSWFHKDNKDMVLAGKYKIKNCVISFSVMGMTGEQYYNGDVSEKTIWFRLTDKESKRGTTRMYTFYAL